MGHPKLILGIDLEGISENLIENGGPNLEVDRVIEIGAVLWDTEYKGPVAILSEIINEDDRLPISKEIEELTGLSEKLINEWGKKGKDPISKVLLALRDLINQADCLMSHNARGYDGPMLTAMYKRYNLDFPEKTWIDSVTDIEYPSRFIHKSLMNLEHYHGFVNPFPHRAFSDVLSMLKVASHYPWDRMKKLADSPRITIRANLSSPNWRSKSEVDQFQKEKGRISRARFKWNPNDKTWTKQIHKVLIDEGKIDFPFDWYISE